MKLSRALNPKVLSVLALLSIAISVAGCGSGGKSGTGGGGGTTGGGSSAKPTQGGNLSVSLGAEFLGLTPSTAFTLEDVNVESQIFETLFKENFEGKVVPWLLEGFKATKNDTVWTMRLKKGVDFSTGKPMTAADVVWSLERSEEVETLAGITEGWKLAAPSSSTVVLTTPKPTPELPELLSRWGFGVMPKGWDGGSEKEFNAHPIGTGPFEFVSWKKGEALTLGKNPHYWMPDRPYLDEVVYRTVQNPESRTSQLRGGELDMAEAPPFPEIESLEQTPDLAVDASALGTEWFLVLNNETPLFENQKAREAVDYALDRESMVDLALHGQGEPMNSYLTPSTPDYDASLPAPEHNAERAKELLAEAVAEGVKPTFAISAISESPFWTQAVQIAQANLEEAGFTVSIKKADLSSVIDELEGAEFDAAAIMNYGKSSPAELLAFYNATRGSFANVDTKALEKLLSEAQMETDAAKRTAIYARMQRMISEEHAVISVAYSPFIFARQGNIAGSFIGNTGILWLGETGFTK
jgi:peptide/nickel transport system substrate-binding protein